MLTGAPPSAVSNLAALREGLRSFTPLKPSTVRIGLLDVLMMMPLPVNMASSLKSA